MMVTPLKHKLASDKEVGVMILEKKVYAHTHNHTKCMYVLDIYQGVMGIYHLWQN